MKDYYRILNVPATATPAELRKAFRTLAMAFHPDLAGERVSPDSFHLVHEAYEVLRDRARRRAYDAERRAWQQRHTTFNAPRSAPRSQPGAASFTPREATARPTATPPVYTARPLRSGEEETSPADLNGIVEISLEDSLKPVRVRLELARDRQHPRQRQRYVIELPGKLVPGMALMVPGLGYRMGGRSGDLRMEVAFAAHDVFRLCGETLFYDVRMAPWEAALGFHLHVPTLEGEERVVIPPCTGSPYLHRLPGKGIYRRDGTRGELWVQLRLEVTPPTTYRARRLWAELASEYAYQQRGQ